MDFFVIILIICVILAIVVGAIIKHNEKAQFNEYNRLQSEECAKRVNESHKYESIFREKYAYLGEPAIQFFFSDCWFGSKKMLTRENCFDFYGGANSITVWPQQKKFLLHSEKSSYTDFTARGNVTSFIQESIQKPMPFDFLISCEVTDDATVIHGGGVSTTKTSKLEMITRGVVGGALFGKVGALAGAMTANTSTETTFNSDKIIHNYRIHLTLNDFSCPLLTLELGNSELQMRQVSSVLKLILKNS